MAHSLEVRTPFLDYRIVELVAGVDVTVKMKCLHRKNVLRKTVGKRLPQQLLKAPKRGFGVPIRDWLQQSVKNTEISDDLKDSDLLFDTDGLQNILDHGGARGNVRWNMLLFSRWARSVS